MTADPGERALAALVSLACHDLRTPLATIGGFAKTMIRAGELPEREARFTGMIDTAAGQLAELIDLLGLAARIAGERYDPVLVEADTLALASASDDERVAVTGAGVTVLTDPDLVGRSLAALALATLRYGQIESVAWAVDGRRLTLSPVPEDAAPVVDGSQVRDLGALVAGAAIACLDGSLTVEGETLVVLL
ncbi:MAG TPA: histidine kinase dimerization/phospho-acceptor domain-containing protein [Gaiellaceae bacterium]|nr:histidine kinase dimerization/phospho-acceptor domain-containing protein [Gaiellaceae bacterium]